MHLNKIIFLAEYKPIKTLAKNHAFPTLREMRISPLRGKGLFYNRDKEKRGKQKKRGIKKPSRPRRGVAQPVPPSGGNLVPHNTATACLVSFRRNDARGQGGSSRILHWNSPAVECKENRQDVCFLYTACGENKLHWYDLALREQSAPSRRGGEICRAGGRVVRHFRLDRQYIGN